MIRAWALFAMTATVTLPTTAVSAQYLCAFDTACLTETPTECDTVDKRILARTEQDTFGYNPAVDAEILEMLGNVDLIGDDTIVTGKLLPVMIRLQLPDAIRQTDNLLYLAERISAVEADDDTKLQASGPTQYLSPMQRIAVPFVTLHINNQLQAQYDVDVGVGLDLTYHGTCEELV